MFRLIFTTAGLHVAQCSEYDALYDDDAALGLLQLKVDRGSSNTTGAHNWWRNGGCAADLADPVICGFNTDTHLSHRFAGGSTDEHRLGAQPLARTTDDSTSIDAFQCAFSRGRASVCGVAMTMGDHKIECEALSPDCHSYLYCELDGEPLTFDTFPKQLISGLLITKTSPQVYCFDSPDGRSSVSIRSNYMNAQNTNYQSNDCRERTNAQTFGRAQIGATNWLDGQVRIEKEIAVTGDDSLCGGPGSTNIPLADSLFGTDSKSRLCARLNADGAPDCENVPEPEPAPTAEEACSQGDCSFETAQKVCAPLEQHDFKYQGCLLDVCSGCGNSDDGDGDMEQIADDDVAEEELEEPGPECVDVGAECDMPGTCQAAVKVSLDTVSQNNLAGVGPDAGAEEIRFTSAALVGDTVLDLVVKAVGGNYKGKESQNGKKGEFGVTSMRANHDVELEFTFEDSSTGEAVVLDSVALSFYDLDEGKKGKARTTVTACGATNAILTTNTELSLQRPNGCFAVSSAVHGGKANNPTAPGSLTQEQGGRSVTLVYDSVSSVKVTLAVSKGFGFRNTFWSFQPSLSCLAGEASDLPLRLTEPVDMSVPSDRTCPQFVGLAQCQEGVSGERFKLIMGRGSQTIGSCNEMCKAADANYNGVIIEMWDRFGPGGVATIPTGKDSNVDNHCQCVRGCGATQSHAIGEGGGKSYVYTMFCPPWQPWCNMDIWDACLQQKLQTKKADGTPWTWLTAV